MSQTNAESTLGIYNTDTSREIDRLSRDKLSIPPGMEGILCIKFHLFRIKNTDFWAAYGGSRSCLRFRLFGSIQFSLFVIIRYIFEISDDSRMRRTTKTVERP